MSLAKLRTRTGCLQCRKRRKKCEENRPICTACTRNALICEWPSNETQSEDGRARHLSRRYNRNITSTSRVNIKTGANQDSDLLETLSLSALSQSSISSIQLPLCITTPTPFTSSEYTYLYKYFATRILPRLVRQTDLDQTHMLYLALQYPPLFGVMVSIAGSLLPITVQRNLNWPTHLALRGYLYTIHALQSSLRSMARVGCDDRILATVVLLSVFESCRSDTAPTISPHVTATGFLLAQRNPRNLNPRTKTTALFDRICMESFLYHASLMMLFDPALDALRNRDGLKLPLYFDVLQVPNRNTNTDSDANIANQLQVQVREETMILQTSYKFFLLIADITKLSRKALSQLQPLALGTMTDSNSNSNSNSDFITEWRTLETELSAWSNHLTKSQDISLSLYYTALQILLQIINPDRDLDHYSARTNLVVRGHLQRGLRLLKLLPSMNFDIDSYPPLYLLWPVSVLGAICARYRDREIIRGFILNVCARKLGGQGPWVRRKMEGVWEVVPASTSISTSSLVSGDEISVTGLRILLNSGSG